MRQDLQLGESVVVNLLDLAVFHRNFIEMKKTNRAETVLGELFDVVPIHVEDLQQISSVKPVLAGSATQIINLFCPEQSLSLQFHSNNQQL